MDNYKKIILKKLKELSEEQRIFFLALSSEYILPNYLFYKNEVGNKLLEEIIVFLYQSISSRNKHNILLAQEFYSNLENLIPDLDDDESSLTSYGFDCCILFGETLLYIINNDFSHLENVSTILFDTVDMFVQEKEAYDGDTIDLDNKIINDFYMQREIKRQVFILQSIENVSITTEIVAEIRQYNRSINLCDLTLLR